MNLENILITGSSGLVGAPLVTKLLNKSNLIVGVCSSVKKDGGINILDMSIGRGGDIQKYIQKFAVVVCF